jgi:hypothetical protein
MGSSGEVWRAEAGEAPRDETRDLDDGGCCGEVGEVEVEGARRGRFSRTVVKEAGVEEDGGGGGGAVEADCGGGRRFSRTISPGLKV